jgi:hypothetical protein
LNSRGCYSTGAAEDGRAPTEELSCLGLGLLFDDDGSGIQVQSS